MPYITKDARVFIDQGGTPRNSGELNYSLTKMILAETNVYEIRNKGKKIILQYIDAQPQLRYQVLNDVAGAILNCTLEYARRYEGKASAFEIQAKVDPLAIAYGLVYHGTAVPYENEKIKENGDVYGPEVSTMEQSKSLH